MLRTRVSLCLLSILFAISLAAAEPEFTVGRTPWGAPDLQGMWVNDSATPLERPKEFSDRQNLSDEEFADLQAKAQQVKDGGDAFFGDDFLKAAIAKGSEYRSFDQKTGNYNQFWISDRSLENRTSLIVDPPNGRLPALTEAGRARMIETGRRFLPKNPDGPEELSPQVRCITYGVPYILAGYNSYFHFLQTPDHVVIYQEMIHDARIIPLDGRRHLPTEIRQWNGDPRGHWEGDTLVVDSVNFSPKSMFKGTAENLHLTERFRRLSDDTLEYSFTVDDPTTYAAPWTAVILLKASEDTIFEYACHEGNVGMAGILSGARAEEAGEK